MVSGQKQLLVAAWQPVFQSVSVTGWEDIRTEANERGSFGEKSLRKER